MYEPIVCDLNVVSIFMVASSDKQNRVKTSEKISRKLLLQLFLHEFLTIFCIKSHTSYSRKCLSLEIERFYSC